MTPTPDSHRARSMVGHYGAMAPSVIASSSVVFERSVRQRLDRLRQDASRARSARRSRARTMRAFIARPGGRWAWRYVPAPPAPVGAQAVVRPLAVATCDMDRPIALGRTPFPLPLSIGHECVAEVLEIGDEVHTVAVGDRVVVPFQINCGACPACRRGHTASCTAVPPLAMYGFGLVGGHWGGALADELLVPFADGMLVGLPPGIDPGVVASVADTVCDGYRHIAPHLGAALHRDPAAGVVILAGFERSPVYSPSCPLYAGLVARALGAGRVHFVDRRPEVRGLARRVGLTPLAPDELRDLEPAPLVVDVTGHPRGLGTALRLTAADGVCSSAGGLRAHARVPNALMFARNQTLHVGRTHARALIPEVLDLVARGALHPQAVTTTSAGLDDAPSALGHHYTSQEVKTVLVAE